MDSSMDESLDEIRAFIGKHVGGADVADDEDLFELGYVNSLFAVQIVMFVQNTLGVPVSDNDLDIKNFSSIAQIEAFVTAKRPALA
jgi:methoxymalonate biosynthesis acyl carrier protein